MLRYGLSKLTMTIAATLMMVVALACATPTEPEAAAGTQNGESVAIRGTHFENTANHGPERRPAGPNQGSRPRGVRHDQ